MVSEVQESSLKVVFVLHNAPGHLQGLLLTHQHIQVEYLSENTTSLPWALDQRITVRFRSCYICHTFGGVLDASEKEIFVSVSECRKLYRMPDCIVNVKESMDDLKFMTLIGFWRSFGDSPDSMMK
jgi:hypothetical protein